MPVIEIIIKTKRGKRITSAIFVDSMEHVGDALTYDAIRLKEGIRTPDKIPKDDSRIYDASRKITIPNLDQQGKKTAASALTT